MIRTSSLSRSLTSSPPDVSPHLPIPPIRPADWKPELSAFRAYTEAFHADKLDKGTYKGVSGYFGSYAQRDGKTNMLRLRLPAGRIPSARLATIAAMIREYHVSRIHFTTCQTIQLHDLSPKMLYPLMERALDEQIMIIGCGGDYPRNVMCSPLSGVEAGEAFDVLPWAEAASAYLLHFIPKEKLPRKWKVGFSNSPANHTHATYRDLGFVARPDGTFDVYSAGGLGVNPQFGILTAEAVAPEEILYYIQAMWRVFLAYGDYQNRSRARSRYIPQTLGGVEPYRQAFQEKLAETRSDNLWLSIPSVSSQPIRKATHATLPLSQINSPLAASLSLSRVQPPIHAQKQVGLYTVQWAPLGGQPNVDLFCALSDALAQMEDVEVRLAPDQTAYIINLTASEAVSIAELIQSDTAQSLFELSTSCIGGATCQVGLCDSQGLLAACVQAVRKAAIPNGALPPIHISGCFSSCGTHQTSVIGLRGVLQLIDGKPQTAFLLTISGDSRQGQEQMGREVGVMLPEDIPSFFVSLGQHVAEQDGDFMHWFVDHAATIDTIAAPYLQRE